MKLYRNCGGIDVHKCIIAACVIIEGPGWDQLQTEAALWEFDAVPQGGCNGYTSRK